MKTKKKEMTVVMAEKFGMCFGVRDALRAAHEAADAAAGLRPVVSLGELVHNPEARRRLREAGVRESSLDAAAGELPAGSEVIITAHGAADGDRRRWSEAGHRVHDTTCPLVRRAHHALAELVGAGFQPVVIGQRHHVEVRGLTRDFANAVIVEDEGDIEKLPAADRIGIVSQTTQPIDRVLGMVERIRGRFPQASVMFRDTVCQPTKDRQAALRELCQACDVVIAVGGAGSSNTAKLAETARHLGAAAYHVENASQLRREWFRRGHRVGVTAGTSTLDETVQAVADELRRIAAEVNQPAWRKAAQRFAMR